jgi:23S rRNA (cytosine1962-C5)-methyltransferase
VKSRRFTPKRYQLSKEAVRVAQSGHPWIFRTHLSSAAEIFPDGQWLELVDGKNHVVAYGIYQSEGLIGVRVFAGGAVAPTLAVLSSRIDAILARRAHLRNFTNAWRAVHGDNDGIPAVVVDIYGDNLILQTYSSGVDTLGRYVAALVAKKLKLKSGVWKQPSRRKATPKKSKSDQRVLFGRPPGRVEVREGKLTYSVDLAEGQKSGAFLDLRGLRKWITLQKWSGYRVLNLFSYSGTLGLAAEAAGAREVWNVDVSPGALEFAKKHNAKVPGVQKYIPMDIFEDLAKKLAPHEKFDVIIVDPPSMASEKTQVPRALAVYRKIYREVLGHLTARGTIVGGCCTSRITRADFRRTLDESMSQQLKLRQSLASEDDHPVGFAEGDYLKILIYSK